MDNSHKELMTTEFLMRENLQFHSPVEKEMYFYDCIKSGDINGVNQLFTPLGGKGFGVLSDNPLNNLKYHLIITIAFTTRFCVEGGMERETAYNLSDLYIRQVDKATSVNEINIIHKQVVNDFTNRMNSLKYKKSFSKPTIKCFEYIHNHLNDRIIITEIAKELNLTVPYISKIFHKESGYTITDYIMKKKIEFACQMLKYSDYSAADIGNFLAFSSHSHFISCFKKVMNTTPKQYQSEYYNEINLSSKDDSPEEN